MAKRYSQTFDSYWRGILQRKTPRAQDAGYVNEALNVAFIGGAVQSRPGLRPFNGVAFNGAVRGMGWHVRSDGTRELLVAAGTNLQRCAFGGDPIDMPLTGLPTTERTRAAVEKVHFLSLSGGTNTTFIYDGVNTNLKWDGTVLSKMGLPQGPTPAVPTPGAGVIPKGTRFYVLTLVSPYHEGDCGAFVDGAGARKVVQATAQSQVFASPVDGVDYDDPQVTKWRLWRTVDAGAALRFVGEADIGVSITDNTTDEVLNGRDLVEQLVNLPPQAPIVAMVEHRGQLIAVMSDDQSILRFSNFDPDYMVPEGWPRNFVQPVTHGDGDIITALRSFYEWCVIFKQNSSHALVGDSFAEYKIMPILAGGTRQGIGCGFPGSILQIENAVFFAARDGIYRIDRSGGLGAQRITKSIDDLYAAANFALGSATYFDRKKRIFNFLGHG